MTAREVRPPDLEMQVRLAYERGRTRLIHTLNSPTGQPVGPADLKSFELSGGKIDDRLLCAAWKATPAGRWVQRV